jgi:hypothetical protein
MASRAVPPAAWRIVLALAICLVSAPRATAQQPGEETRRLTEILEGLEHGLVALERLERHEEHEMLQRVANDVRRAIERHKKRAEAGMGGRAERQIVANQIDTLRLALPALREAERREAVIMVERAIRAREVMLEGRRDQEARQIRQQAPDRQRLVKLLALAEGIYRKLGMEERAAELSRLTEELWPKRDRPQRGPQAPGRREAARKQLEVMRMALPALREAGRQGSAELLERAIHAREVDLKGREDREAAAIRRKAPTVGQQIELLQMAAELWRELDHPEKAEAVGALARRMRSAMQRRGDERARGEARREARQRPQDRRDELLQRIERLERRIAELEQGLKETRGRLRQTPEKRR